MRKFFSLPIDWLLVIIPLILTITGVVTIYTITFSQQNNSLALTQLSYAAIGIVLMLAMTFNDYRALSHGSGLIYLLGLALLTLLIPPLASRLPFVLKIYGASRWISLGAFQVQPSEIFKLIAAIVSARILSSWLGQLDWKKLILYLLLAVLPVGLILLQPDLGTASIVIAVFVACFLAARPSRSTILLMLVIAAILIPTVWFNLQGYQQNRIETFLDPSADPLGQGYNIRQALIAVGSGGLTGRGFGQGSQTVLNFLPVPYADFIFAGFAEATGFIGSAVLLLLYGLLLYRCVEVARISTDPFGQILAIGITVKLFVQIVVHIGMNIGVLPVTGIPLPFMSYGGTALIMDFVSIGILQSIYIRHKKTFFAKI